MDKAEIFTNILLQNFLVAALVNYKTDEYISVKSSLIERKNKRTLSDYNNYILSSGLIHPDDTEKFREAMNPENIRKRLANDRHMNLNGIRFKKNDVYIWIEYELFAGNEYNAENPWFVFIVKKSDFVNSEVDNSMRILSAVFHKILKINLTNDSWKLIKMDDDKYGNDTSRESKISVWLKEFALKGFVHKDDLNDYLSFVNFDSLKNYFKVNKDCIRHRYRRKIGDNFRWVSMELVPDVEYTDENQVIMLYVKDINDDYISEVEQQKMLEYYCNKDVITDIYNRYCYYTKCNDFKSGSCSVGIIFSDLNGLKYINDTYGHIAGDEYIKKYAVMLCEYFGKECCYRISGDEFVVIAEETDENDFIEKAGNFTNQIQNMPRPIAAVGYEWHSCPESITSLVKKAEEKMYINKKELYRTHPLIDRRRSEIGNKKEK
jgi:diguanylate cyclase (GGDEF)-like protein